MTIIENDKLLDISQSLQQDYFLLNTTPRLLPAKAVDVRYIIIIFSIWNLNHLDILDCKIFSKPE